MADHLGMKLATIPQHAVPTGTADQVMATAPAGQTIVIVADPGNPGTIDIGAAGLVVGGGVPLAAGDQLKLDGVDASSVYCIAASAGNFVRGLIL